MTTSVEPRTWRPVRVRVPGCRLFSVHPGLDFPKYVELDVYDSSGGGRTKYLCDRVNGGLRGVRYLLLTEGRTVKVSSSLL